MAEIIQTKPLSAEEAKEPSACTGVGAVLRNEREKKGLTLDQVASVTRLRLKMVEALENETWGDLPPPVFVRGFIRSYAGILGLDGKELLHLYERVAPIQPATSPLAEERRRSYKRVLVPAVILALVLGGVTYLQVEHPVPTGEQLAQKKQTSPEGGEKKGEVGLPTGRETLLPLEAKRAPGIAAPAPAAVELGMAQAKAPAAPAERQGAPAERQAASAERQGAPAERQAASAERQAAPVETAAETISPDPYVLKAVVLEETWVRIRIDNGESKEYIFQPGARPQWKGKEGFHLTVGNAGGIEFELNGTKLKSLGKQGKVVKRNIPESFEPTRTED